MADHSDCGQQLGGGGVREETVVGKWDTGCWYQVVTAGSGLVVMADCRHRVCSSGSHLTTSSGFWDHFGSSHGTPNGTKLGAKSEE